MAWAWLVVGVFLARFTMGTASPHIGNGRLRRGPPPPPELSLVSICASCMSWPHIHQKRWRCVLSDLKLMSPVLYAPAATALEVTQAAGTC